MIERQGEGTGEAGVEAESPAATPDQEMPSDVNAAVHIEQGPGGEDDVGPVGPLSDSERESQHGPEPDDTWKDAMAEQVEGTTDAFVGSTDAAALDATGQATQEPRLTIDRDRPDDAGASPTLSGDPGDPEPPDTAYIPGTLPGAAGAALPQPPIPPMPPAPAPRPRGRFVPLFLGGLVAGAIGFGASWYLVQEGWLPGPEGATEELAAAIAAQEARLAATESALSTLRDDLEGVPEAARAANETLDAMRNDLGALEAALGAAQGNADGRFATLEQGMSEVARRIDALERMPFDASDAAEVAVESYRREIDALRSEIDALGARTEDLLAEARAAREAAETRASEAEAGLAEMRAAAEAAELSTRARTALRALRDTFDSGAPYDAALNEVATLGLSVPPPLAAHAGDGVPTMSDLQESFPPAARAALASARRDEQEDSVAARLWAFVRTQIGARSLTPREGDDPDAVLSRTEAALRIGDLGNALTEIATFPDAGRAHLEDWIARAEIRHAAGVALANLTAEIESL